MNGVSGHDSALQGHARPKITWAFKRIFKNSLRTNEDAAGNNRMTLLVKSVVQSVNVTGKLNLVNTDFHQLCVRYLNMVNRE